MAMSVFGIEHEKYYCVSFIKVSHCSFYLLRVWLALQLTAVHKLYRLRSVRKDADYQLSNPELFRWARNIQLLLLTISTAHWLACLWFVVTQVRLNSGYYRRLAGLDPVHRCGWGRDPIHRCGWGRDPIHRCGLGRLGWQAVVVCCCCRWPCAAAACGEMSFRACVGQPWNSMDELGQMWDPERWPEFDSMSQLEQ